MAGLERVSGRGGIGGEKLTCTLMSESRSVVDANEKSPCMQRQLSIHEPAENGRGLKREIWKVIYRVEQGWRADDGRQGNPADTHWRGGAC